MPTFTERLKKGWNAFVNNKDPAFDYTLGASYSSNPDRMRYSHVNERSMVSAVFNRIAVDSASIDMKHVRTNEDGYYLEEINSGLNNVLDVEANVDQTGRAFRQDCIESMLDEGVIAVVPIDTDIDPITNAYFDIYTCRVGKIVQWYPQHVKVRVMNDRTGIKEDRIFPKTSVAIFENPFYAIMNEPNSTLKRLTRKLSLLDIVDEQSGQGKLDLIIQLPYVIKSEARKKQAEERRKDIEMQLSGSKYGIAYTDGTEHITQLNRSLENNLLAQVEYLQKLLFSQLGITEEILNGTANSEVMQNYYTRTIEPILSMMCDELKRKFISKTARTQRQTIMFFRDPFKLATVDKLASVSDVFTRNEIMSSNELRSKICLKPSTSPRADELSNKNMPQEMDQPVNGERQVMNQTNEQKLADIDGYIDKLQEELNAS